MPEYWRARRFAWTSSAKSQMCQMPQHAASAFPAGRPEASGPANAQEMRCCGGAGPGGLVLPDRLATRPCCFDGCEQGRKVKSRWAERCKKLGGLYGYAFAPGPSCDCRLMVSKSPTPTARKVDQGGEFAAQQAASVPAASQRGLKGWHASKDLGAMCRFNLSSQYASKLACLPSAK